MKRLLLGLVLTAGCTTAPPPAATPTSAPTPEFTVTAGLRHVANVPPGPPFDTPESFATDLAFQGRYAFAGNYGGFTVYDIGDPTRPTVVTRVLCPADQNDVSVYNNLLFLSVDVPRAGPDCSSGPGDPSAETQFEGVRIFDITDVARPRYVTAVRTPCGSHTNTIIPGDDVHHVYASAAGPAPDTARCPAPHELVSVIEVPAADPAAAKLVATPVLFTDRDPGRFGGCHDVSVLPAKNLAVAACYGDGLLLDITDRADPKVLQRVTDRRNFSIWHSAAFTPDGTKVVFSDELGGGTAPMCTAEVPGNKGGTAIYEITGDRRMRPLGLFKIPRVQSEAENCVAHNGNVIPIEGRNLMVQAWYQGGVSVWDFTDPAKAREVAAFDRAPLAAGTLGGSWSAYFYNGYIYSSDITRGLDVLELTEPSVAGAKRLPGLNPQTQE
ncbi:hypothetical protein [Herbidospora sp. NBRC 101105]|uniref:LVIVD repeat-containing protein n=1 Tax=Herbidospora sp. NBRC 101105 TaxID=3032195 RepID=UPI0024A41081|nr:hypothetical protein [Herbidospora sp. NBRC 101105]GLX96947.1 hypothetical protein Hesp01_48970 [Herbidospora sp. NBRC 101105]